MPKKIIIIGAGPAGLTAAYELLKDNAAYEVIVLEDSNYYGGISRTINYDGNFMDMGPHRLFSKNKDVNEWWENMLPTQGEKAIDDIKLKREATVKIGGPDPNRIDNVMLRRKRVSRILIDDKFYDYPFNMKIDNFINLGIIDTLKCGFSYLVSIIHKLPENSIENFFINRFGKKIYKYFLKDYAEKLWGRHPREIDASWGKQRIKSLSVFVIIKDIFSNIFDKKNGKSEKSLIKEFSYPKLGSGQLWNITATKIIEMGGKILLNSKVIGIHKNSINLIDEITYIQNGIENKLYCDIVISSMPLKDLVIGMNDVPNKVYMIAEGLPYRDYMAIGVLVRKLKLKNNTTIKTISDIIPDSWVYVPDRKVKLARFMIYNNWSPYMINDIDNTVWLGLDYFVQENDEYWKMSDEELSNFVINEMYMLGLIDSKNDVLSTHIERIKKAYPAYYSTFNEINTLIYYLNNITNLYCVGRNGQHRYNNIDHSMCTAFEAVKNIKEGIVEKNNIWAVNTEKEYIEEKTK